MQKEQYFYIFSKALFLTDLVEAIVNVPGRCHLKLRTTKPEFYLYFLLNESCIYKKQNCFL